MRKCRLVGFGLLVAVAAAVAGGETATSPSTQPATKPAVFSPKDQEEILALTTKGMQGGALSPAEIAKVNSLVISVLDERMKSTDIEVRKRAIEGADPRFTTVTPEWIAFFTRAFKDESPAVRGAAIHRLYDLWVDIPVGDLPLTFTGFHAGLMIDRVSPKLLPELDEQCRKGGAEGGYAAYAIGLVRMKGLAPQLKALGQDENPFARYSAARALISCGEPDEGRAILEFLIGEQLSIYDRLAKGEISAKDEKGAPRVNPYYVIHASRTLMVLGPKYREAGLRNLVRLMQYVENQPDKTDLLRVQEALRVVTGQHFGTVHEAQAWLYVEVMANRRDASTNLATSPSTQPTTQGAATLTQLREPA